MNYRVRMSPLLSGPLPIPVRHQIWKELSEVAIRADADPSLRSHTGLSTVPLSDGISFAYDLDPWTRVVTLRIVSQRKKANPVGPLAVEPSF